MCNERFNISKAKEKKIHLLFDNLFQHNVKFKCKKPCTTNKYTTRLLNSISQCNDTAIKLVFDRTLEVTRSTFSINGQTFLTSLGGDVSSGRTLFWILVTLLGASQVISEHFRGFEQIGFVISDTERVLIFFYAFEFVLGDLWNYDWWLSWAKRLLQEDLAEKRDSHLRAGNLKLNKIYYWPHFYRSCKVRNLRKWKGFKCFKIKIHLRCQR